MTIKNMEVGKTLKLKDGQFSGFTIVKGSKISVALELNEDDPRKIITLTLTEDVEIDNDYPIKGKVDSVKDEVY